MSDKPIIFSAPMVNALLAGRKLQTRRALKPQPDGTQDIGLVLSENPLRISVSDRLWVKETWCDCNSDAGPVVCYRADYHRWQPPFTGPDEGVGPSFDSDRYPGKWCVWAGDLEAGTTKGWRNPRYMPRWASRITLHVTEVRVQRLQEISEEDAAAEGLTYLADGPGAGFWVVDGSMVCGDGSVEAYEQLWEHINGPGSWDANPWVAAYTFTVERCNIDASMRPHADGFLYTPLGREARNG